MGILKSGAYAARVDLSTLVENVAPVVLSILVDNAASGEIAVDAVVREYVLPPQCWGLISALQLVQVARLRVVRAIYVMEAQRVRKSVTLIGGVRMVAAYISRAHAEMRDG
jgi:hypothetical protein